MTITPESIVILLLLFLVFRSFGWTIKLKREKDTSIIFHPNPLAPGGGHFEIPEDADPQTIKNLFSGANSELLRHNPGDTKHETKPPGGYA